jgi:hypothetical protein
MKCIVYDILKSIFEENKIHMHALKSIFEENKICMHALKSIFEENKICMHALKLNILESPYKIKLVLFLKKSQNNVFALSV